MESFAPLEEAQKLLQDKSNELQAEIENRMIPVGLAIAKNTLECYSKHVEFKEIAKCQESVSEPMLRIQRKVDEHTSDVNRFTQSCLQLCHNHQLLDEERVFKECATKCLKDALPLLDSVKEKITKEIEKEH